MWTRRAVVRLAPALFVLAALSLSSGAEEKMRFVLLPRADGPRASQSFVGTGRRNKIARGEGSCGNLAFRSRQPAR